MQSLPDTDAGGLRRVTDPEEWDALIGRSPGAHLLQSAGWGALKARYGWGVDRFVARTGDDEWAAAQVLWRRTPLGSMAYVPRGPVAHPAGARRPVAALLNGLHAAARARRAVFLRVEPNGPDAGPLPDLGFRPVAEAVQPRATVVLDLQGTEDELLARMPKQTRYGIRMSARRGVVVHRGAEADFDAFFALLRETGVRDGFPVRPAAYYRDALSLFGGRAELLLAEHEGDVLGGVIVARFGREAVYMYGASSGRKRNLEANRLLQWEAMRWARTGGCTRYDMWGVPDELAELAADGPVPARDLPAPGEDRRGELWGVYHFKRSFGGSLVAYAGALDCVYRPAAYRLWTGLLPRALSLWRRGVVWTGAAVRRAGTRRPAKADGG